MNKIRFVLLLICFVGFCGNSALAQSFKNVSLVVENSKVIVYYDLVDTGSPLEGSFYTIKATFISDNKGAISPSALTGDLTNVSAGVNKTIVWSDSALIAQLQGNLSVELEYTLFRKNLLISTKIDKPKKKPSKNNTIHYFKNFPIQGTSLQDTVFSGISVDGFTSSYFSLGIRFLPESDNAVLLSGKLYLLGKKETALKCYLGCGFGSGILTWKTVSYVNPGLNISIGPISLLGEYFLLPTQFVVVGAGFNF